MIALTMMQDEQPKDLDEFVRRYHLRRFDGQSNECLRNTPVASGIQAGSPDSGTAWKAVFH